MKFFKNPNNPIALLVMLLGTLLSGSPLQAQDRNDRSSQFYFVFVPHGLTFPPLRANIHEARIGVFKFLDHSNMKVDIGNTMDVFAYLRDDGNLKISAGIDFMGYALTTGSQGLRLQIDALDGFFGGNLAIAALSADAKGVETGGWRGRLRFLHHSAHLVDGHYDRTNKRWIDNREPIAFTRDFGELVISRESARYQHTVNYRVYGGLSYATLVRPATIKRFEYLAGAEAYSALGLPMILEKPANFYLAYNISLMGTPAYLSTHQVQWGVKFGDWYGKGPTIFLGYYSGRHMFAEYYDLTIRTIGAGFTVDF